MENIENIKRDDIFSVYKELSNRIDSVNNFQLSQVLNHEMNNIRNYESKFNEIKDSVCLLSLKNEKDLNDLKSTGKYLEELNRTLKEYKIKAENFRYLSLSLENRLNTMEIQSNDGEHLWKITNFKEKLIEAKAGRLLYIDSSSFYLSEYGYKMSTRLYLNGDGNGKGSHLSLYFILLKGDYDNLLQWPFKQQIKFILIDQNINESKNLTETFKPDPNSISYKKPISYMNVASGLPLFCSHQKLFGPVEYVKDNTLFVKTVIDLANI